MFFCMKKSAGSIQCYIDLSGGNFQDLSAMRYICIYISVPLTCETPKRTKLQDSVAKVIVFSTFHPLDPPKLRPSRKKSPHVHPGLSSACLLQKGCRTFGICLNPFDSEFLPELWMKVTSTKPPRGWDFWTKLASKKSWFHGFVLTPLWAKKMLISTSWGRRNQPRSLRAFWTKKDCLTQFIFFFALRSECFPPKKMSWTSDIPWRPIPVPWATKITSWDT